MFITKICISGSFTKINTSTRSAKKDKELEEIHFSFGERISISGSINIGRKISIGENRDQDEERRESRDLVILNTFQSECDKMVKRLTKANAKDKAKIRVDAEAKFEKSGLF